MITIKSKREIELLAIAGNIVYQTHKYLQPYIKEGIKTIELDKLAEDFIRSKDATPSFKGYEGFPYTCCISVNSEVVHGFPSNYVLKNGDIVSIDIGACYKGYHGDAARTHLCGNVSEEKKLLVERTKQSLFEGLKFAKPNNRLSDISHAIETYVKQFGYEIVMDFTGHGIGTHLHEDPAIPNYGPAGRGVILKKGMTLAIEPMINAGTHRVKILSDDWTVVTLDKRPSAHYENTIVITDNGYEILTKLEGESEN